MQSIETLLDSFTDSQTEDLLKEALSWPELERARLVKIVQDRIEASDRSWIPEYVPDNEFQRMWQVCMADIAFFGGAAGTGKTFYGILNALANHTNTLALRARFKDLRGPEGLIDGFKKQIGKNGSWNGSDHQFTLNDGRIISLAGADDPGKHQGKPYDLIWADELAQIPQAFIEQALGWNRTTVPGQRCRFIGTGNPPLRPEEEWVIDFFSPWLDEEHPNPAKPGELRWFFPKEKGGGYKEVDEGYYEDRWHGREKIRVYAKSRTFIPGRMVSHLLDTGYFQQLSNAPAPLRAKLLEGDFKTKLEDDFWRVIKPSAVEAAMRRWKETEEPKYPITHAGTDISFGGTNDTVQGRRKGPYFLEQKVKPGREITSDEVLVDFMLEGTEPETMHSYDAIGVGKVAQSELKRREITANPINSAVALSDETDASGKFTLINERARLWWRFKEALEDPDSEICLPPDRQLKNQLCLPTWRLTPRGIAVEKKEDIIARLIKSGHLRAGESIDKGDCAIYTFNGGDVPFKIGRAYTKSAKRKDKKKVADPDVKIDHSGGDVMSQEF
jgi:hypothetical protein